MCANEELKDLVKLVNEFLLGIIIETEFSDKIDVLLGNAGFTTAEIDLFAENIELGRCI